MALTGDRITLCLPTRGRPRRFHRTVASAFARARGDIEVVAWVDDDDPEMDAYQAQSAANVLILSGPREVQSNLWNRCWSEATGDIAMLCADDCLFQTPAWDRKVRHAFDKYPDRIALVHGDDGTRWKDATFPFVSREWIEAAGYFTPPHFRSWFADRWIWEVAYLLGRKVFLPGLKITHEHPAFGRGQDDQTYEDGRRFRAEQDPKALYFRPDLFDERVETAKVLNRYIREVVPALTGANGKG